jgi:hypothetical protein
MFQGENGVMRHCILKDFPDDWMVNRSLINHGHCAKWVRTSNVILILVFPNRQPNNVFDFWVVKNTFIVQ